MLTPKKVELTSAVSRSRSLTPWREVFGGHVLDLVGLVRQHQLAEDPVPWAIFANGLHQVLAQAPLAAGHQHGVSSSVA